MRTAACVIIDYASQPAANNYLHIDGKTNLEGAYSTFVNKALVSVCMRPRVTSAELAIDEVRIFIYVKFQII